MVPARNSSTRVLAHCDAIPPLPMAAGFVPQLSLFSLKAPAGLRPPPPKAEAPLTEAPGGVWRVGNWDGRGEAEQGKAQLPGLLRSQAPA